jgi:hypothetical protein
MVWLAGWTYRKVVTISNTGPTLTDYQASITIDTATLIYAGRMRSDCGDIRFIDDDGSTYLPYWIESGPNTISTKIWIKIPSVPTSKTIYLYYGNAVATYNNSTGGTNTFIFFDDFESGTLSKWDTTESASIVPTSTSGGIGQYSVRHGAGMMITKNISYTLPVIVEAWHKHVGNDDSWFYTYDPSNTYRVVGYYGASWTTSQWYVWDSTSHTAGGTKDYNWHLFKMELSPSNTKYYVDGVQLSYTSTQSFGNLTKIALGGGNGGWGYGDDVRIRKYASPEPTLYSISSEETPANITATSMTITRSEIPCRVGICTVTVYVTWTNTGESAGIFTPSITVDGNPVVVTPPLTPILINPSGGTVSQSFIVSGLAIGTRSICPVPN